MSKVQSYIPDVLDAHFDEAVFLYGEFVAETSAMNTPDSVYLDRVIGRLKANLHGLALNETIAWTYCDTAVDSDDPGEFFVASFLAFLSGDLEKIKPLADAAHSSAELLKATSDALAWHPWSLSSFWATKFVSAKKIELAAAGFNCFAQHQQTAPLELVSLVQRALSERHLGATLLLLDLAVKHTDTSVVPALQSFPVEAVNALTFHVLSVRLRLGDHSALDDLKAFVLAENEFREAVITLALPLLDKIEAKKWVAEIKATPNSERWVLLSIGAMKEKVLLPWVIKQMESVALSRIAGKVFTQLTGIDLKEKQWLLNDDSIDQKWMELEGDEELDWPDVHKIKQAMQGMGG